jgi:hypothetical protein
MAGSVVRSASCVAFFLVSFASLTAGCPPAATCADTATCPDPPDASTPLADVTAPLFDASSRDDAATPPDAALFSADVAIPPETCASLEICTNGIDDDCNGLVDCADPACGPEFECVDAPPDGWSGPGVLFRSGTDLDASALPACPAPFTVDALDGTTGPTGEPATCACACDAPAGASCSTNISFYYDTACANLCASSALSPGTCSTACSGAQTLKLAASVSQSGACAPQSTAQVSPVTWASIARVCSSAAPPDAPGGCGAGRACLARPPVPFTGRVCIWQSGQTACPDPAATRYLSFSGAADTRGCSVCTCGAPQGVTCNGASTTTFSDVACTTSPETVTSATNAPCVTAPAGIHGVESASNPTAAQGSCAPSEAIATGSLTPVGATTICCSP